MSSQPPCTKIQGYFAAARELKYDLDNSPTRAGDQFSSIFWMIASKFDIVLCPTADASIGIPFNSMTARNSDAIENNQSINSSANLFLVSSCSGIDAAG
jgi:hypothetical protein